MAKMAGFTVEQVQRRASSQSYARGQRYAKRDAIFDTVRRDTLIEASCQGSDLVPYRVRALLGEDEILSATCTCPYDWGGDCKHIVALLLTYIQSPGSFVERKPLDQLLAERGKDELVGLIQEMIARYPDLEVLLDRPTPGKCPSEAPVDTTSFRRELRQAMRYYGGWGDRTAEYAVHAVVRAAAQFADRGDWISARAIYGVVLDECLDDADMFDDEGEFLSELGGAVAGLIACLERPEIAGDDAERRATLDSLLDAYVWDVDFGGIDLGDAVPDAVLKHAAREDLPAMRERVRAGLKGKLASEYGEWGAETYGRFLMELDAIDADPETVLARLREHGLHRLVFEKLLSTGRSAEAIEVVEEHLTQPYERFLSASALAEAGHPEPAIRLAKETLEAGYDRRLAEWLLEQHRARGEREAYLQLQRERMHADPSVRHYAALGAAAEDLGRWETIRPQIIRWLGDEGHEALLTRVYLYEEDWDAAWETLEKVLARRPASPFDWERRNLEREVAERSRHARPHKAIPIFVMHAEALIGRRERKYYQAAARDLLVVRDLYRQTDDEAAWQELIARIRAEYKRLPALQDELDKAGL